MISMQHWTCVSYMNVVVFKGVQRLGQKYSHVGENFIFSFRQKSALLFALVCLTWGMLIPSFAIWTVLGTHWFRKALSDHPSCLSTGVHPWLVMFWQILSYLWISIYVFYFGITCNIERKRRLAENNMRLVESDDSRLRWGQISPAVPDISPFGGLSVLKKQQGLEPREIHALPTEQIVEGKLSMCHGMHCPICLSDFCMGDKVRALPSCGHYFHQACVDLWLLRRADCPMCKCEVR